MEPTFCEDMSTETERSRNRRISGTANGLFLLRSLLTASDICDLNASSSCSDENAGESCCRFARPGTRIKPWGDYKSFIRSGGPTLLQDVTRATELSRVVILRGKLTRHEVRAVRRPPADIGHDGCKFSWIHAAKQVRRLTLLTVEARDGLAEMQRKTCSHLDAVDQKHVSRFVEVGLQS